MNTRYPTDEELERMIANTLSCPPDLVPPPGFACGVWDRIDAWEAEQERKRASRSILARLMETRMRNGEPVIVLAAALLFGALFVGLFLAGTYMLAAHSSAVLRVVQVVVGPNLDELRSLLVLCTLTAVGGLLLGSLALSERLFGQKSTPQKRPSHEGKMLGGIEPTCRTPSDTTAPLTRAPRIGPTCSGALRKSAREKTSLGSVGGGSAA